MILAKSGIEQAFGVSIAMSSAMQAKWQECRDVVMGRPRWVKDVGYTLGLANTVSQKVAARVANGTKSVINGGGRAEYLNEQYAAFLNELYYSAVKACNGGEIILKPYMIENGIEVSVVENNCYWPLAYNFRGELTDVVFAAETEKDGFVYRVFERQTYDDQAKTHSMTYRAFKSKRAEPYQFATDSLGEPVPVRTVPGFKSLMEAVAALPTVRGADGDGEAWTILDIESPLFVHVKMPTNEIIEYPQRQGLPIWSKALTVLEQYDRHWERLSVEVQNTELMLFIDEHLFKKVSGIPDIPKGKERVFVAMLGDEQNKFQMETFNPEPRVTTYREYGNMLLQKIEFLCGLSRGTISDNNLVAKTAEEYRKSQAETVTTVSFLQLNVFQPALEKLIESFNVLADLQMVQPGEYEVDFEWNEDYAVDRIAEGIERREWQRMGVLSAEENRAWYFDVDAESEIARAVPGIQSEGVDF